MRKTRVTRGKIGKPTRGQWGFMMLFTFPTLFLFLLLNVVPMFQSAVYSLYDYSGYGEKIWVGFDNYIRILKDTVFHKALINDFLLLILKELIVVTLSVLFAVSVTRLKFNQREVGFFRFVYYVPEILSVVITSMMWKYFFDLELFSIVTGLETPEQGWVYAHPVPIVAFVASWCGIGSFMIILIAAINNIPNELYEACEIDGAGQWRQLWSITIPSVLPQIRYMAVGILTSIISSNMNFIKLFLGTNATSNFTVSGVYQYENAFTYSKLGYAYAVSIILTVLLLGISIVLNRKLSQKEES